MKAYGVDRRLGDIRNMAGTSRKCPCCISNNGHKANKRTQRKRARVEGKRALRDE